MLERDEDLNLSLSLGSSGDRRQRRQVQLNFMQAPTQWTVQLASSSVRRETPDMEARPMLRGIDVNRAPAAEKESGKGAGASSLNSTISNASGKRGHAVTICGSGGEIISDEEEGKGSRKKLRISKDQSGVLEKSFNEHKTLNLAQKQALARQLNLRTRQVEVWFQNRRARTKLKQTEMDCELLKQCCQNLTDENQRLQKEVGELRALRLSPQFYIHIPATLKMCPSCEHGAPLNNDAATMPASVGQHYLQHSHNQLQSFHVAAATTPMAAATTPTPELQRL